MTDQAAAHVARQIRNIDVKNIEVLRDGAGWAVYVTGWSFATYIWSQADVASVVEWAARDNA